MEKKKQLKDITLETVVMRDPEQDFSTIDDEVIMVSLKNGEYYTLNYVASKIWMYLEQEHSVAKLVELLEQNYNVPRETCIKDTIECLADMRNKSLINRI